MATTAESMPVSELFAKHGPELNDWFDRRLDEQMAKKDAERTPSLSIISTKGTMDWAYPPFILASTAAALGWDVAIFFTFYGLSLLRKDLDLKVSPLGNPAMPMKMPMGPDWFRGVNWNIPNAVAAAVPGFETFATSMMAKTVKSKGVASIEELRAMCIEAEVKLFACQMTVDLFSWSQDDFVPEVAGWIGAASYLPMAQKSDISLFI